MDVNGLIESFATNTYTVTRRNSASPAFARGIAQATTNSTFTIRASIQPASGRDLLRLPELRRSNETRVIFTTTPLLIGDAGDTQQADWINVDGVNWEVQHVETWLQGGIFSALGGGYRCIVQAPTDGT